MHYIHPSLMFAIESSCVKKQYTNIDHNWIFCDKFHTERIYICVILNIAQNSPERTASTQQIQMLQITF